MEKDKEIKGDGNSYTTEFRQYDPRLGRWLSLDPEIENFPHISPYVAFENNPVYYTDVYGASVDPPWWAKVLSNVADYVPLVGQAKAAIEALRGRTFDGQELSPLERLMVLVPGGKLLNKGMKLASTLVKGALKVVKKSETVQKVLKVAKKVHGGKVLSKATKAGTKKAGTAGGKRAGKNFTKKGKKEVIDENKAKNSGTTVCEDCGTKTVPAQQSKKGVTPPKNETQVDHIVPKSKGGDGDLSNGQVLCRDCNIQKSDKMPVDNAPAPYIPSGYNVQHLGPDGSISKVGIFKDGELYDGKHYHYDADGILHHVDEYKNGQIVKPQKP